MPRRANLSTVWTHTSAAQVHAIAKYAIARMRHDTAGLRTGVTVFHGARIRQSEDDDEAKVDAIAAILAKRALKCPNSSSV